MQPMGQAIPKVVADLLRNSPNSPGKVEFAWKAVVGGAIGRVTRVRLEGQLLIVEAETTAWTRELSRSAPFLLTRLQRLLGPEAVKEILIRA